jgi:hypothetical protein
VGATRRSSTTSAQNSDRSSTFPELSAHLKAPQCFRTNNLADGSTFCPSQSIIPEPSGLRAAMRLFSATNQVNSYQCSAFPGNPVHSNISRCFRTKQPCGRIHLLAFPVRTQSWFTLSRGGAMLLRSNSVSWLFSCLESLRYESVRQGLPEPLEQPPLLQQ